MTQWLRRLFCRRHAVLAVDTVAIYECMHCGKLASSEACDSVDAVLFGRGDFVVFPRRWGLVWVRKGGTVSI